MHPGGDGLYYFSTYLCINDDELFASFEIVLNDEQYICGTGMFDDPDDSIDLLSASCTGLVRAAAGNM